MLVPNGEPPALLLKSSSGIWAEVDWFRALWKRGLAAGDGENGEPEEGLLRRTDCDGVEKPMLVPLYRDADSGEEE